MLRNATVVLEQHLRYMGRDVVGKGSLILLPVPFDFGPKALRQIVQTLQYRRIIELTKKAFVLGGESWRRRWNLPSESFQFGRHTGIDIYPFAGDLNESPGEIAVKTVLAAANDFLPPARHGPQQELGLRRCPTPGNSP